MVFFMPIQTFSLGYVDARNSKIFELRKVYSSNILEGSNLRVNYPVETKLQYLILHDYIKIIDFSSSDLSIQEILKLVLIEDT